MMEVNAAALDYKPIKINNAGALKVWRARVLKSNCAECYGLCCVGLHFAASEGFPLDKAPGKACPHLQADFRCGVHETLSERGYKGCIGFDCLGAGQRVSRVTFPEGSWKRLPGSSKLMFEAFVVMRHLYELLWYLSEALERCQGKRLKRDLTALLVEVDGLTFLTPEALVGIDVNALRLRSNVMLTEVGEQVRGVYGNGKAAPAALRKRLGRYADFAGASLRGLDLSGANFRGAVLIAADLSGSVLAGAELIGADLRDARLHGADLREALYLTQAQVNSAKGDLETKLPDGLERPVHWR
ncbi:pentapeptide repeat-containing protein [Acidaminobacter hydrogenoformans]|uniref:Pentapeptide repeat-containing protein n=1 Tax=Acidaminobacter hydrogenoformans DSM 2784 TaxID=1120920 RepID=A0A1G5S0J9_9FIRM|nr:pentapeptide repeat-containing protein [Acidaminobacter hydrogenoformans]SCZ79793.1 Pentapeptide repeat-containing protein [Acidaminobacter hydrogenoformans DSM 2784]